MFPQYCFAESRYLDSQIPFLRACGVVSMRSWLRVKYTDLNLLIEKERRFCELLTATDNIE